MTILVVFVSALVSVGLAHMSMSYPIPRTVGRTSQTVCTSPQRAQAYLTWEWNEPMVPARPCVCHGTIQDTTIRAQNVIAAGSTITIALAGTAYHGGGHCAFWWSTDGVNWKKFLDYLDCTKHAVVDNIPINIVIPASVDAACSTRCIFGWTWTPRQSGACEIYMTCADVQITGATGGGTPIHTMQFGNPSAANVACARVNSAGWTTNFGPINVNGMGGPAGTNPATMSPTRSGATARPTSQIITARPTPTVVDTGASAAPGALCPNPSVTTTTQGWGAINTTTGRCGPGVGRCDVGLCCSGAGYCGPDLRSYTTAGVPVYWNYDTQQAFADSTTAFAAYCNANTQADFRLVPCCAIVGNVYNPALASCLGSFTAATTSNPNTTANSASGINAFVVFCYFGVAMLFI